MKKPATTIAQIATVKSANGKKQTLEQFLQTILDSETESNESKLSHLTDYIDGQLGGEENLPAGHKFGKALDELRNAGSKRHGAKKQTSTAPHVQKMLSLNKLTARVVADEQNKFIEVHLPNSEYDIAKKIVGVYSNVEFFVVPAKPVTPKTEMKKPTPAPAKKAVPAAKAKNDKVATVAQVITLLKANDLSYDSVELGDDDKSVLVVVPANELVEVNDLVADKKWSNIETKSAQSVAKQKAVKAATKTAPKPPVKKAQTQPAPKPSAEPIAKKAPKVTYLKISKSADWDKIFGMFPDQILGKKDVRDYAKELEATGTLVGQTKSDGDRLFISDDNCVCFESKADKVIDIVGPLRSPAAAAKFVEKLLALMNA